MIIAAKRTYTMIFKHVVLRMTAIKLKKLWLWGCYVLYHSHEDSNIPILSQPQLQQWSTFAIDIYVCLVSTMSFCGVNFFDNATS